METNRLNIALYSGFFEAVRAHGIEYAARLASELGCTSVEFLETAKTPDQSCVPDVKAAEYARRVLNENGLSVACYSLSARLWEPDATADRLQAEEERVLYFAEIAATLGSPFLHHTVAPTRNFSTPYAAVLEAVLPPAVRIVDRAAALGLTVLYEPQGMYVNGLSGFGGFYRAVKAQRCTVGICGDVGNPLCVNEDPVLFFREFAAEIRHVHLKDYETGGAEDAPGYRSKNGICLKDTVIGQGEVDLASCLELLEAVGYTGAFAIEHDSPLSVEAARRLIMEAQGRRRANKTTKGEKAE